MLYALILILEDIAMADELLSVSTCTASIKKIKVFVFIISARLVQIKITLTLLSRSLAC